MVDPDRNQPFEKSATTVTGSDKEQESRVEKDGEISERDAGATEQQVLKSEEQVIQKMPTISRGILVTMNDPPYLILSIITRRPAITISP